MKNKNIPFDISPVLLFTFNRLSHLQKTINSLKKNHLSKRTELIIFSDGPKDTKDTEKINQVRKYISKIDGFKKIKIYKRKKNFGLSKNIILGINQVFKKFESIIVIEDDLILDKFILNYMNEGLSFFKNNNSVASIHSYIYPIKFNKDIDEYFFLKGSDCWGWATWKRAWKNFEIRGSKLKKIIDLNNLKEQFNFNNSYDYYQMLIDQINGKNDSWAIRWYASTFVKNMYTLYPSKSFVKNIGTDGSGTHGGGKTGIYNNKNLRKNYVSIKSKKIELFENYVAKKSIENYFNKNTDFFLKKIFKKIVK